MQSEISNELIEKIIGNKRVRQQLAYRDPFWFSLIYLRHHFKNPFAPFHIEMYHLIHQTDINLIVVMAFRESGKSTILNMVNVLWSILGTPEKKFAIIFSKTQEQAKNHFANIKHELETNELLKEDFGPFTENEGLWNKLSLELEYHGSKIMSVTREQSIRGIKHNQYRPDLIICDDMEDFSSNTNPSESSTVYTHFKSEIMSVGTDQTRVIVLGNLISEDSLIMKLKEEIDTKNLQAIFRAYPLLDDNNKNLWEERFKNKDTIKKLSDKAGRMWGKEYLLNMNVSGVEGESKMFKVFRPEIKKMINDKFQDLDKKYKHILYDDYLQKPLIPQMKKFKISAPILETKRIDQSSPNYEEYLEYQKELREIARIWEQEYGEYLRR